MMVALGEPENIVDCSRETDEYLLFYMGIRDEEPKLAMDAWESFYLRHVKFLYSQCRKYEKLLGGKQGVCDLVQEAFICVYERANTFDSAGLSGDRLRYRVRAWICTITHRLLQSWMRGSLIQSAEFIEDVVSLERWDGGEEQAPVSIIYRTRLKLIEDALFSLPEREEEIIRVTYLYHQPDKMQQRLPNNIITDLAERWETTPENIRQIRKRALKKVKDFLAAHLKVPD